MNIKAVLQLAVHKIIPMSDLDDAEVIISTGTQRRLTSVLLIIEKLEFQENIELVRKSDPNHSDKVTREN